MTAIRRLALLSLLFLTLVGLPIAGSAQDVSTGPSPLLENPTTSSWMRGSTSMEAEPVQFRLLGPRRTEAGITFDGILLDARGNACPAGTEGGSWRIASGCRGDALLSTTEPLVSGRSWQSMTPPTAMEVVIDHSLTSDGLAPDVLNGIRDIIPGFIGSDSVGVSVFNHQITELSPITAPYLLAQRIDAASPGVADGLPGVYGALLHGLRVLEDRDDASKVLVLVTASNDMTSLGVSTDDIVSKARTAGVTLHIVKVGYSAQGYVYRYMTAATGGRLYTIEREEAPDVVQILREVLYAAKHHIELFIPQRLDSVGCDDLLFSVGWFDTDADTLLADTIMVPVKERAYETNRAVVAAFRDTNEVGLREYYSVLTLLAEELIADSSKVVQLVGHVSPDIKSDHDERALERVGYVAAFLQAAGVPSEQLRIRSDGSRHPLYYLQLDGTQRLLNNRVEAYFLHSADLPFTITVGQFAAEEQAEESVKTWTDRGFKAYFEPIVVDRSPAYQVKLWGYGTEAEALVDAKTAKAKYNAPFAIVE